MGENGPTTRTLPTGEKVTHWPDGRLVLQRTNSLGSLLGEKAPEQEAASAALTETLVQAAVEKRESLDAGDSVSSDKRIV